MNIIVDMLICPFYYFQTEVEDYLIILKSTVGKPTR